MTRTTRVRHHVNPLSFRAETPFAGFEKKAPIMVEIGSGRGFFARQIVEKFPDKNHILTEIRPPLLADLQRAFIEHENVHVEGHNAAANLEHLLRPSIEKGHDIETIFIHFPDPWPKKAHHKRRVVNPKLLAQWATWLPAATQIIFQTDHQVLFADTVEYVSESPFGHVQFLQGSPHGCVTHWERQKLLEGSHIYRMSFRLA